MEAAKIADLFDAQVDGVDAEKLDLEGKPAPDIFFEAARRLGANPQRTIVVEDAIAGVQAGSRGKFGCVIGVDRVGQATVLEEKGADIVVADLSEIAVRGDASSEASTEALSSALECMEEIMHHMVGKRIAVFLDYDGTLTPIVERPEQAVLSQEVRDSVKELANHCTVAIISGRDLQNVQELVGIDTIFYAGSHGFDIAGPKGRHVEYQQGKDFLPVLDRAEQMLHDRLKEIRGALIERKKFSIAVHYRKVQEEEVGAVEDAVDEVLDRHEELRKSSGKKMYEVQPKIEWDKGRALLWLLEKLELDRPDVLPLYIGDDITDEHAFKVLRGRGIGIVVRDGSRRTAARYALEDPDDVQKFLKALISVLEGVAR
jgi:alpha,alpha-trehalase